MTITSTRAAELLRAYPGLSEPETNQLLDFFRSGPITEIGLLAGNPEHAPRVAAFRADHAHVFEIGWRSYLTVTFGFVLVLAGLMWLLWDSGLR